MQLPGATFVSGTQAITSDGRAVYATSLSGQITLGSADGSQVFTVPPPTFPYPIVSDDGSWIVGASGATLYSPVWMVPNKG